MLQQIEGSENPGNKLVKFSATEDKKKKAKQENYRG